MITINSVFKYIDIENGEFKLTRIIVTVRFFKILYNT